VVWITMYGIKTLAENSHSHKTCCPICKSFCTIWARYAHYLLQVIHSNIRLRALMQTANCILLTTRIVILYRHWILKYSQWSHSKTVFLEYPPATNARYVNGTTPRALKLALRKGCPPLSLSLSPLTLHLLASSFICSSFVCLCIS
jgi:hypothetical protein